MKNIEKRPSSFDKMPEPRSGLFNRDSLRLGRLTAKAPASIVPAGNFPGEADYHRLQN